MPIFGSELNETEGTEVIGIENQHRCILTQSCMGYEMEKRIVVGARLGINLEHVEATTTFGRPNYPFL